MLLQGLYKAAGVVLPEQPEQLGVLWLLDCLSLCQSRPTVTRRQQTQLLNRRSDQLSGSIPLIHKTFYGSQALDLRNGIDTLSMNVALWHREAVTPLPHSKDIFGEPGVALYSRNAEAGGIHNLS
jgi:hypothetical protein